MHEDVDSDHDPVCFILPEVTRCIVDFSQELRKAGFNLGNVFLKSHYWQKSLGTYLSDEVSAALCVCFDQAHKFVHALLS